MTEFEQQIAGALEQALGRDIRVRDGYSKHFAAAALAPQVAAALIAAWEAGGDAGGPFSSEEEMQPLALAALRGVTRT